MYKNFFTIFFRTRITVDNFVMFDCFKVLIICFFTAADSSTLITVETKFTLCLVFLQVDSL